MSRDSAELVERLARIPTAILSDQVKGVGVLGPSLRPMGAAQQLCGPAATALCRPDDGFEVFRSLVDVSEGQVLVASGLQEAAASFGGIMLRMAQQRKLAGVVVDGFVRDLDEIAVSSLPVYARGATPRIRTTGVKGESSVPVTIDGVTIIPGDFVRGDADGVVVVSADVLQSVIANCESALGDEAQAVKELQEGMEIPEMYSVYFQSRDA